MSVNRSIQTSASVFQPVGNSAKPIDMTTCNSSFSAINSAALRELPVLLSRWLPGGRTQGREYVARNPRRDDRNPGSFKVNIRTGRWADFATGDKGGDPVSLAAYLFNLPQIEAARALATILGVS